MKQQSFCLILFFLAVSTSSVWAFGPAAYAACVAAGMASCAAGATAGTAVTAGVGAGAAVAAFSACEQAVVAACIPMAACFGEDTQVYQQSNLVNISDLKPGDIVDCTSDGEQTMVVANVPLDGRFLFVHMEFADNRNLSVTEEHILITDEDNILAARDAKVGMKLFPGTEIKSITRSERTRKYVLITSSGTVMTEGKVVVSTVCEGSLPIPISFSESINKWRDDHKGIRLLL